MRRAACFFLLAAFTTAHGHGQSQQPTVKTTTAGVLIDVSVIDNKGRPVLDLTGKDFELKEDGKPQQIVSVTLVQGGVFRAATATSSSSDVEPPSPTAAAPATPREPGNVESMTPTVTAILFDRLSNESRVLAHGAALAYVSTLSPPNDYAGVFLADLALRTFQPFTNNADSLREALVAVAGTAPANTNDAEYLRGHNAAQLDQNAPPTAGVEARSGWVNVVERERMLKELPIWERMLVEMELRMEQGYRQFLAEYAGEASVAGLRAVVNALGAVQGRKSILYFTESLSVTDKVKPKFDEVIGLANRANVTFYPVDAAGLRVHSEEARVNRHVSVAGGQGIGDVERDRGAWTKELERQEQLLSSRPTAALGRLAKETGGFVIDNTNDLGAGVARMQQERTTYYLLGYQPTNVAMDGKFRRVSVKVKRPKVSVRARPGYLAIPPPGQI